MIQRHTPWSLQEGQGEDSYIMDSNLSCVGVVNFHHAADGRFIVAAVNAHADMLAALTNYLEAEDIYNKAVTPQATAKAGYAVHEKREAARAAIAKASQERWL
mgnify:CR=1 FL=1